MATTKPIDSWTDLTDIAESCADGGWIFRGEATAGNLLVAKAGREGSYRGAARKKQYKKADEIKVLESFKRQARPYLSHTPSSDLEWLAIAQHHGMPTRLLDWTESVLVAAFFAAQEAGTKGEAVIYGVLRVPTLTETEAECPFDLNSPGIYKPPHITPRIPAQRSVFTVHPDPRTPFIWEGMEEWRVSEIACGQIKQVLDACAVNEASLFPDIDGLSRYIGWQYKWGKL